MTTVGHVRADGNVDRTGAYGGRMLVEPDAYTTAAWLFLRAVGITSTIAFASLAVQLRGLYSSQGILPIAEVVEQLRSRGIPVHRTPSLFRVRASDRALWTVTLVGTAASLLVTVDVLTLPALVVAWSCYLSFSTVGRAFLSYQWDVLLLEVLVIAAVVALRLPPPEPVLWLLWFFLFRFMVQSGAAKLLSGDETWRDGTALTHHHETQPLPTRCAWHLHQLPRGIHRATTVTVLAIEIGVPFLLVLPWPWRALPLALLLILQVGIVVSGNYGFFNLLALVLLIPLVPDAVWHSVVPDVAAGATTGAVAPVTAAIAVVAAAALLAVNALRTAATVVQRPWIRTVLAALAPFRLANRYGLFAVMTASRPEIVVEGSHDGEDWTPYRFRYKPTDPQRPPRWNAPHQPRLDWQLWFAALGTLDRNAWFLRFLERLLEGSRPVTSLLAEGPDPDDPPAVVRAQLYDYVFTDRSTRERTGRWWERTPLGAYAPPFTLRDGELVPLRRA